MANKPQKQELELAARTVDLGSSIIKSPVLDLVSLVARVSTTAGTDVIEWLARERIPKDSFVYTMELGQNVAQPNVRGINVLESLEKTSGKLFGLNLIMPGAVGRTILYDNGLRWIGTTEAVILKYHTSQYAVDALCHLFASTISAVDDSREPVVKARIRPVISKVVDSIHLHTVNMGHGVEQLPDCVKDLPKHYLQYFELASAIKALLGAKNSNVLVQMNCCIAELLDWILHHWNGWLTIVVNNKIGFDKTLGDFETKLTVMVHNECTSDTACHDDEHVLEFKIGNCIGLSFNFTGPVYVGCTDPDMRPNESSYRTSLYDIRNPFQTHLCKLNDKELKEAEREAQEIVRSIVDLPITPLPTKLGFRVDTKSKTTYRWWLKKTPTILQKNLSSSAAKSRPLFDGTNRPWKSYNENPTFSSGELARLYPEILAGLGMAFDRCDCGCNNKSLMDNLDQGLDSGCLIALMFSQMMLYIAHAMAEAAGATDVSNLRGVNTAVKLSEATANFLGIIAYDGKIFWVTWFRLAAASITGLPYDTGNDEIFNDIRSTTSNERILLCVAGSMTIAPAWLKFDSEIRLEGSWGVQQLTGSVRGLEAQTALVQSQPTSAADNTYATREMPPQTMKSGGKDIEDVQIENAIFCSSNTGEIFRLTSIVKTKSTIRILDPIAVYHGAMLAERPICSHETVEEVMIHAWSLNDVVLGWNDWSAECPETDGAHIALLDGSPIKQNIALGFAKKSVLQDRCCFGCLTKVAKDKRYYGISSGPLGRTKKLLYR